MWTLTLILALLIALLQSTVVPSVSIFGGIFDLCFIVMMIMLFYGDLRQASFFLLVTTIFLSVLSQVPIVYLVLPNFVLMVIYLFLLNRRLISRPTNLFSLLIFAVFAFLAILLKTIIMGALVPQAMVSIISGTIYSAFIGGAIYYTTNRIYYFLNPQILREKIKIGRF